MTIPKKLSSESFALALQLHMGRLGLTQPEAATLLKVSPRRVWQWLKAERDTDFPTQVGAIEILKFAPVNAQLRTVYESSAGGCGASDSEPKGVQSAEETR